MAIEVDLDLKTVQNNINKMTNSEKITFIETLLGASVTLSQFLMRLQERILIAFPPDIHYLMLLSIANIKCLSSKENTGEIVDYSLKTDSYQDKLIDVLKQLNEIYKDELK